MDDLRKGLATNTFNCGAGVSYSHHFFHCWIGEKGGSHGTLGVSDAIKVSCNSFFYQFGNAAGIEAIDDTGDSLGLGKASGIEITSESPGVLPGPDWMRIHYPRERWSQAYTANVSIGQGYDLVTPLQLAMVYATVASPIAARILERTLAMDQGTFDPQLAWLAPAHKSNPFQSIPVVEFKDSSPKLAASDEENLDGSTNTDMATTTANPDVELEAAAAGKPPA